MNDSQVKGRHEHSSQWLLKTTEARTDEVLPLQMNGREKSRGDLVPSEEDEPIIQVTHQLSESAGHMDRLYTSR